MQATSTAPEQQSTFGEIVTAVRHTCIYGIGGVLVKGIGFLLLPLYTHYLSPRDYGLLEVLELGISLLAMFLNMGVTAALLRYHGAAQTAIEKRKIISTIFVFAIATSAVVFVVGSLLVRPATYLLLGPGVPTKYLFIALVAFLIAYIGNVPYTALRAREASGTVTLLDMFTTVGLVFFNIYFVVFLHMSVMGMLLSRAIMNVVNVAVLVKLTSGQLFGGVDWKLLRIIIAFGAPLVFSNLTMFTLNFSDRFFLQHFQSLEVVGTYAVGYKFAFMLSFLLIQPFNMMWDARMYIVHRRPDHQKLFARMFSLYSASLIYAGLGIAVFGPELMNWMVDPRYAPGGQIIGIVCLSYVFLGMGYFLQTGMFLTSRTGLVGVVSTGAAALNIIANYFLILRFGMFGAAWATVLGFVAIAVGSYYYSQRVCPLNLPIGRAFGTLAVAVGMYFLAGITHGSSMAMTLLLKGGVVMTYPGLLWMTGCVTRDDVATLDSVRAGVVRRTLRLFKPAAVRTET